MGTLHFGPNCTTASIPDRTLRHLQIVMVAKLRRSELFTLTLSGEELESGNMTAILCAPSAFFEFEYERPVDDLNTRWIEVLTVEAATPRGLSILPEPIQKTDGVSSVPVRARATATVGDREPTR